MLPSGSRALFGIRAVGRTLARRGAAGARDAFADLGVALDLEAEVVEAANGLTVGVVGEDRDREIPVAQEVAPPGVGLRRMTSISNTST